MAETIIKTFEYKIRTTKAFIEAAERALDASRLVYNCALEQRIMRYRQGRPICFLEQCRELTQARTIPWVGACLRKIQEDSLRRLDLAFQSFFNRLRRGETAGFPRFKTCKRYHTFSQAIEPQRGCPLVNDVLKIPGVATVRVRLSRPIEGTVKQLRIKRRADGWYALLVCDMAKPAPLPSTGKSVGVDVGLTHFATLSTGQHIENPKYLQSAAKALSRSQRSLSRKVKQSNNYAKASQRVALRHLKVSRSRKDFHNKTALDLVRQFDVIKVEDLRISNMLKNRKLAKSISDAGWGQFLDITERKAENAGRTFERVDPRYTSQDCSRCGARQKILLAVRVYECACGLIMSRDENAAQNILLRPGRPKVTPAESHTTRRSRNRWRSSV